MLAKPEFLSNGAFDIHDLPRVRSRASAPGIRQGGDGFLVPSVILVAASLEVSDTVSGPLQQRTSMCGFAMSGQPCECTGRCYFPQGEERMPSPMVGTPLLVPAVCLEWSCLALSHSSHFIPHRKR
jgi:hypothetical protein